MKRKISKKKGLSPVVATILLILLVVIIAAIILLWAKGFIQEKVSKFDKPISRSCAEVNIEATISGDELSVINNGNVPIYDLRIKKKGAGKTEIEELGEPIDLGKGGSKTTVLEEGDYSDYEEVILIPVLKGESGTEYKEFTCDEMYEIEVEVF